jgi:hypothetical protein
MGAYMSLAMLVGVLAGGGLPESRPVSPPVPRMPRADDAAAGPVAEAGGEVVVLPEDAAIRIAPGNKFSVRQVQTGRGPRIRLEVTGVAIEAPRMRVLKSNGQTLVLEAGPKAFTATIIVEEPPQR